MTTRTSGTKRSVNNGWSGDPGNFVDEEGGAPMGRASGTRTRLTYEDQSGAAMTSRATYDEAPPGESSDVEAFVDELAGIGGATETESDEYSESQDLDQHTAMRSPARSFTPPQSAAQRDEAAEEADTESAFEFVEGWDPTVLNEADGGEGAFMEASFADAESQEFFPALGALLVPLAKAVLPTLAGAVVQQGARTLSPRLQGLLKRLSALGLNPASLRKRESGEGDGDETGLDESALGALEQQIEALEVIIGRDDRTQVTHTTAVPWLRLCHLEIRTSTGRTYTGSGFFVGPRTIITAGHCVYIHGQGGWASQIKVTPGRNGSSAPFSSFVASDLRSVRGWVENKSRNHDYGAIILPRGARVSPRIGGFGFGVFSDTYLRGKHLNTAGYPGDKPPGTMWFHGRNAKAVGARTITYDIDTMPGQSGSAVWIRTSDGKRIVVGIHTNGASSGNSATRVTRPVFDNLKRWRQEGS